MIAETPAPPPSFRRRRPRFGDAGLRILAGAAAIGALLLVGLLVYKVTEEAWPSISEFGLAFLWGKEWNAVTGEFGALYLIWGTAFSSLVAIAIAAPVAIAIGLFLSELAPRSLRAPVGALVELLAAIPSVVLGLWGIIVLGPFLQQHVEPWLADHLGFIPFFSGDPSNVGLLPAAVVLTIMIIPIVASISRELFLSVPGDLKQGSLALGSTRWEMVRNVAIPQVSAGLVAAVILGLARALGEAIAVSQVIGGGLSFSISVFHPADTLAGRIASQYQGSTSDLQTASLAYLAVILLVMSLIANVAAQLIVRRIRRRMGVAH
jgi:phosphate transport system permease protein